MTNVNVINQARPLLAPLKVRYCASYGCKLRGLTFRAALDEQEGLLMDNGRPSRLEAAIHMMGVFFDLGIVWLDDDLKVVDVKLARRWVSMLAPKQAARYILEVHPGRLTEFEIGDGIEIIHV